jgi:hypothetical protein
LVGAGAVAYGAPLGIVVLRADEIGSKNLFSIAVQGPQRAEESLFSLAISAEL